MAKQQAKTKKNKTKGFNKLTKQLKKLVITHGTELAVTLVTGIVTEWIAEKVLNFKKDKATKKENKPVPAAASAALLAIKQPIIKKSAPGKVYKTPPTRKDTTKKPAITPPAANDPV